MPSDLTVDVGALRPCVTVLSTLAAATATGIAQSPPLGAPEPGWATAGALDALQAATARRFTTLADGVAAVCRHLSGAADAYESTDSRAATRLRSLR